MKNVLENKQTKLKISEEGEFLFYTEILRLLLNESRVSEYKIKDLKTELDIIDLLEKRKDEDEIKLDEDQVSFLKTKFNDDSTVPGIKHRAVVDAIDAVQSIK